MVNFCYYHVFGVEAIGCCFDLCVPSFYNQRRNWIGVFHFAEVCNGTALYNLQFKKSREEQEKKKCTSVAI